MYDLDNNAICYLIYLITYSLLRLKIPISGNVMNVHCEDLSTAYSPIREGCKISESWMFGGQDCGVVGKQ